MQLGPGEVRRHRLVSLSPVIPRLHSAPQYLQMFLIRDETTAVAVILVRTVRKHKLFVEGFRCLQQNDGSIIPPRDEGCFSRGQMPESFPGAFLTKLESSGTYSFQ